MADDERLLELLAEALIPPPAEPSAERVAAVRRMAEASGRVSPRPVTPIASDPIPPGRAPAPAPAAWRRRRGWLVASAGFATAALVAAVLAVSGLVGSDDGRSPSVTKAKQGDPVSRLRVALLTQDPVAVAQADADLLREAGTISNYRHKGAVAAHVAAVQFLRDHPAADVLPDVSPPDDEAPAGETAPEAPVDSAPSDPAQGGPPGEAATEAAPTTAAPDSRSVTIDNVIPRLDGTFQVEFSTWGFTPDASGQPGAYAVRFFFDEDQSPAVWGRPSPWSFPLSAGLLYHRVCAHVVDATGAGDPATGGCRNIL